MAVSYSNVKVDPYTTLDCAPDRYTTITGVMTTNGIFVTGFGTLFTTEIYGNSGLGQPSKVGEMGYIFNGVDEVREIAQVVDNTHLTLKKAFTTDIVANRVVKYCIPSRTMQMSWVCISAGGKVDNVTLAANESSGAGYAASTPNSTVHSIVVDGTGGQVNVTKFMAN